MKEKVILPFDTKPLYKTYAYLFFYNGIISGNNPAMNDWIISHWLDLTIKESSLGVLNRDTSFLDKGPLLIETNHSIYYNELTENPEKVIKKIIRYISEGYYIEGSYDEYDVSACLAYHRFHMPHYYNIYGYNNNKALFYAIGYTKNNKLEPFTIGYTEFVQAVLECNCDNNYIAYVKYNGSFKYDFDWNSVYNSMSDFLNSKSRKCLFDNKYLFGVRAQDEYINHLVDVSKGNDEIDMRNCRLLMEYKSVIHKTVKRHPDYEKIAVKPIYIDLYNNFDRQHYLGLKYEFNRDKSIITKMVEILKSSFEKEETILRILFE